MPEPPPNAPMVPQVPRVAVGGVVFEDGGEAGTRVLLIKRGRPPLQGRWSLPGGRVEAGERLADALTREIREESGLDVQIGPLVEVVEIIEAGYHYVILDYACERAGGELLAGDDATEALMVPVSELARYGVTEAVLAVITRALEMRGTSPASIAR